MSKKYKSKTSLTKSKKIKISQVNRIRNGGFENSTLSPWIPRGGGPGQILLTTTNPHSGLQAVRIAALPNQNLSITQRTLLLRTGRIYQVDFWVRRITAATTGFLRIRLGPLFLNLPIELIPLSTYRQFTIGFSVPRSGGLRFVTRQLEFRVISTTNLTDIVIDDVSLSL